MRVERVDQAHRCDRGEPGREVRLRHQHGGAGIAEHVGEPIARIVGIERHVGAAGLQDAERPDHELGRSVDAEPDEGIGSDAQRS